MAKGCVVLKINKYTNKQLLQPINNTRFHNVFLWTNQVITVFTWKCQFTRTKWFKKWILLTSLKSRLQFVPFRDYMDRTGNHVLSMARLAKDVLAEIPEQLILYMKSRGIKPNQTPPDYSPPVLSPTPTVWGYPAGSRLQREESNCLMSLSIWISFKDNATH